tara:strand:- start:286 stop:465 length:180 start_codon:yes stop_codon:yes gene_type:complete
MKYKEWIEFGAKKDYIRRYIKDREKNLKEVKQELERVFTPKIKSMLSKKIRDEIEKDDE